MRSIMVKKGDTYLALDDCLWSCSVGAKFLKRMLCCFSSPRELAGEDNVICLVGPGSLVVKYLIFHSLDCNGDLFPVTVQHASLLNCVCCACVSTVFCESIKEMVQAFGPEDVIGESIV